MTDGEKKVLANAIESLIKKHSNLIADAAQYVANNARTERAADVREYVLRPLDEMRLSLQVAEKRKGDVNAGRSVYNNILERLNIIEDQFTKIKASKSGTFVPTKKDSATTSVMSTKTTGGRRPKKTGGASNRPVEPLLGGAAPVAAPSANPLSPKDIEDMSKAIQDPNTSEGAIEALGARAIAALPLVFNLGPNSVDEVTKEYMSASTDPVADLAKFNNYAASVSGDYARVRPNQADQAIMVTLRGPGGNVAVDYDRVQALVIARQLLLEYYVGLLAENYASINPPPVAGSAITEEFKNAMVLARNVNRDYKLDLNLLEQFRIEVGRLSDRSKPSALRRFLSYATGFLNPFNYKARRVIAVSAIALALGSVGVLAYSPEVYSSLGILSPSTASGASAYLGRLFSSDFVNALSSGSKALLEKGGAMFVDAGSYVWNYFSSAGAGNVAGAVQTPLLALPSSPYVAAEAAQAAAASAPGYASAALNAGQGLLSGVAGAAGSTYEYLVNLVSSNPGAAAAAAGVGLAGVGASAAALNNLMTAKQVEDAGALIKEVTIGELEKNAKTLTSAQGGRNKAQIPASELAVVKEGAHKVDSAGARVTAAADAIKNERVSSNIPVNAPITSDPKVATAIAAIDDMAAKSNQLKTISTRITQETLSGKHMTKHTSKHTSKTSHKKGRKSSRSTTKKRPGVKSKNRKSIGNARSASPGRRRSPSPRTKKPARRHTGTPRKSAASTTKRAKARVSRRR